jgi:hypothetical protein
MPIANVVMRAVADPRIKAITAYHTLGVIANHADETGTIHPSDDGEIVTDPEYISRTLGVTKAAVFRAYGLLHDLGYVEWQKAAFGAERRTGVTGRIRILVSAQ